MTTKKECGVKNLYFWGIILIMFAPLIHSKTAIYGTVVHRYLYFWLLIDVVLIATALIIPAKGFNFRFDWISISILTYLCFALLSNLFGVASFNSFFSNFERMDGYVSLLHFSFFFFLYQNQSFSDKQWAIILGVAISVSVSIAFFGWIERNHNIDGRVESILSNPMHLAGYLLLMLFVITSTWDYLWKHKDKLWSMILLVLSAISVLLLVYIMLTTKTRAAVLGLLAGITIAVLTAAFFSKKLRFQSLIILVVLISTPALLYINRSARWIFENPILNKMTDLSYSSQTISTRLKLWDMVLNNIMDKPVLGWGGNNFVHFYAKHYSPNLHDSGFWYDSSHNFILDKLVSYGFIGLAAYLFIFSTLLHTIWRKSSKLSSWKRTTFTGLLSAYLIFLFFGFDNFTTHLIFFSVAIYIFQKANDIQKYCLYCPPNIIKYVRIFIVIISCLSIWKLVIGGITTNQKISKAYIERDINKLIKLHKEAYQEAWIGKYDIALQFALKHNDVNTNTIPDEAKKRFAIAASEMTINAFDYYPDHPTLLSQLGFVYLGGGQKDKAVQIYRQLEKIAPNRQVNLIDLGCFLLETEEFSEAYKTFEKADKMDTNFQIPRYYMALASAQMGKVSEMESLILSVNKPTAIERKNIAVAAYIAGNTVNKLPSYYERFTNKNNFRQADYLDWANIASNLNDTVSLRSAFVSYYKHFLPITDSSKI